MTKVPTNAPEPGTGTDKDLSEIRGESGGGIRI